MSLDIAVSQEALPAEWLASSVMRHLEDPLSLTAFAEPNKTSIDLGPLDMDACVVSPEIDANKIFIWKYRGHEVVLPSEMPSGLVAAHTLFFDAARRILGEDRYLASEVGFTYRHSQVFAGTRQVGGRPHIDGLDPLRDKVRDSLRLVGLACNVLPTIRLQGSIKREQLSDDGKLNNLRVMRRLRKDPIPVSRLLLVPPALLHDVARADANLTEPVDRLFLRWHLRV